ncbi:MAG: aminotransferase class I/II-fold pyridoxal phosphate-dependent enzyme, partial [Woeseiaceae bacterium]
NPNNPTGTWIEADALVAFLDKVPSDVVIVLDEAYTEYVELEGFPDGMKLLSRYPNMIVTRTFSKIYGLAGLRIGYGVSSPGLASVIQRVRHPFNANLIALAAAEAALDDTQFLEQSRKVNSAGMRQLQSAFDAMRLGTIPSVANFITVDLGREAAPVNQSLLQQGVIVRPVANYRLPNHLRITIGSESENDIFLAAFRKAMDA